MEKLILAVLICLLFYTMYHIYTTKGKNERIGNIENVSKNKRIKHPKGP